MKGKELYKKYAGFKVNKIVSNESVEAIVCGYQEDGDLIIGALIKPMKDSWSSIGYPYDIFVTHIDNKYEYLFFCENDNFKK